jgi:hypothetical protein
VLIADEELHRNASENLERAEALLPAGPINEMLESVWRLLAEPSARTATASIAPRLVLQRWSRALTG